MGTYCTADDVIAYLGIDSSIADPTRIESIIAMVEDEIDRYTMHCWRACTVENELHSIRYEYSFWRGAPIYLQHRKIQSIDKLEIWLGSMWQDITTNEGTHWTADYDMGIIFLRYGMFYPSRRYAIRVSYTYGEATVPGDIKQACILLTASHLALTDDRYVAVGSTGSTVSLTDKVERWREMAYDLLDRRREWKVATL